MAYYSALGPIYIQNSSLKFLSNPRTYPSISILIGGCFPLPFTWRTRADVKLLSLQVSDHCRFCCLTGFPLTHTTLREFRNLKHDFEINVPWWQPRNMSVCNRFLKLYIEV